MLTPESFAEALVGERPVEIWGSARELVVQALRERDKEWRAHLEKHDDFGDTIGDVLAEASA